MNIDERKKVVKGISVTAVLGVIATVVGILANIHELGWFEKEETPSAVTQDYAQPVIADGESEENAEENVVVQEEAVEEEVIPPMPTYSYTRLCDLEPADSIGYYFNIDGTVKDTVGNVYTGNVQKFNHWGHKNEFATYYLGGKYKKLTGTIAVSNDSYTDYTTIVNISGDDNVLYTTGEIDKIFAPVEISLDVEGVQWLKIDRSDLGIGLILYNWQLE